VKSIEEREQNLFNALDTLAQFYDEIESFLGILYGYMERAGFAVKIERLRSGTFVVKNLTRRLLATTSVMYIKDAGKLDEVEDEEEEEVAATEEKPGKDTDVIISRDTRIPLLTIHLFTPRTIPTAHNLSSPLLLAGAMGNVQFLDRKTNTPSSEDSHPIGLSNLGQIHLKPSHHIGSQLGIRCWKPKSMHNYKIQGTLVGFESIRLLEIDSQESIKKVADKLVGYCQP